MLLEVHHYKYYREVNLNLGEVIHLLGVFLASDHKGLI